MAIWSNSPTLKGEKGTSSPSHVPVGSGSRPTVSRIKIGTSAPDNAHTLDRNPPSPLK